MLKTRVLTAVILLACFIPLILLAPPSILFLVLSVVISITSWEWFRFLWAEKSAIPILLACLLQILFFAMQLVMMDEGTYPALLEHALFIILCLSCIFWLVGVPLIMKMKLEFPLKRFALILTIIGFIVFMADWYALIVLQQYGLGVLLSVFFLVWFADIGAYFFGKKFGKHKLAPLLSPGKSIEGAIGGMLLVCLLGLLFWYFGNGHSNFFDSMGTKLSWFTLVLLSLFLTGMSIVGDLFESQLKRLHGVKDSSNLLPGHGGFMDRLDALMPVLPITALLMLGIS
jgi:phosphatidate cytidylyltransferase